MARDNPMLRTSAGFLAPRSAATKSSGRGQSASEANLSIWVITVSGAMPGMMGISLPRSRTRLTSST